MSRSAYRPRRYVEDLQRTPRQQRELERERYEMRLYLGTREWIATGRGLMLADPSVRRALRKRRSRPTRLPPELGTFELYGITMSTRTGLILKRHFRLGSLRWTEDAQ